MATAGGGSAAAPSADGAKEGDVRASAGHSVPAAAAGARSLTPEELTMQERLQNHQATAAKLDAATEIRTLVDSSHGYAVLSTNSKSNPGFPGGSVVGFASDASGRPVFTFSGMSGHTSDLLADDRASLTVAAKSFKGAADGRVNLVGRVVKVPAAERAACVEVYMAKHPGAFWAAFGDFTWFRMDDIEAIRYVGGFARAGAITPTDYAAAVPDPVAAYAAAVMTHMNDDHAGSTCAMVEHYVGLDSVSEAVITAMDALGMYVKVTRKEETFKIRLPFPRPIESRKMAKEVIVEMTRAAASSGSE